AFLEHPDSARVYFALGEGSGISGLFGTILRGGVVAGVSLSKGASDCKTNHEGITRVLTAQLQVLTKYLADFEAWDSSMGARDAALHHKLCHVIGGATQLLMTSYAILCGVQRASDIPSSTDDI